MFHRKVLLPLLLVLSPTLSQASQTKDNTLSLPQLFAQYHQAFFYHSQIENDNRYDTEAFKDCMAKPNADIEAKYQAFFNLPDNRESFQELEKQLNEGDTRGMGTAMAIMFQITLGSMLVEDAPQTHKDIGNALKQLTAKQVTECQNVNQPI